MQSQSAKNTSLDMDKWREIVKEWENSGENQKAYCERLGLSMNTFSYVRGKLLQQNKLKTQFIPLTVKNDHDTNPTATIVLENPRGYKLYLSPSLSLDQLSKLFKLSGWLNA